MEIEIWQFISLRVDSGLDEILGDATARMIAALGPFLITALTVYIAFMGISMMLGLIQSPVSQFMVAAGKIWLITAVALSLGTYQSLVVDGFADLQLGLITVTTGVEGATTAVILDDLMGRGLELVDLSMKNADEASWFSPGSWTGWWACGVAVLIGTSVIAAVGGGNIIVAQMLIDILMTVGPFFIILLIFPPTSRFFNGWFSQALNYTMIIVILSIVMSFAVGMFGYFIGVADVSGSGDVHPWAVAGEVFVLSLFLYVVIKHGSATAASLAGGLSIVTLSWAQTIAPARFAFDRLNPRSVRRDMQSGLAASDSRLGHVAAGNTPLNWRYVRQSARNLGRNWGK